MPSNRRVPDATPRPAHPADRRRPRPAIAADAGIHLLASHLLDELVEGTLEPSLVHVARVDADPADGPDLGLLPLDGRHPTQLLLGFVAPDDWHALGQVSSGWAYSIGERAESDRRRTRVHVVTLLSRSGELAHRAHAVGDDDLTASLGREDSPAGEQIDLLRRALQLATDDPPCPAAVYWSVEWLSSILALDADEIASWADVIDAHPARRMLTPGDELRDAEFTDIASSFARVADWGRLRRLAADGLFTAPELSAVEAQWLDDGSFARFVLNRCPPLSMLRRQAIAHLPGHLAERLVATLDELGVPRAAWPDDIAPRAA